jgi:DNA polymerase-1
MERILRNDHPKYTLDACCKRRKMKKDPRIDAYIKQNKLYTNVSIPGKKKRERQLHYEKVPFQLMTEYGLQDAVIVRKLGVDQRTKLKKLENSGPSVLEVVKNERKLTKTVSNMGFQGIKIDRMYCEDAAKYEAEQLEKSKKELEEIAGIPLDTTHFLKTAFDKHGYKYEVKEETENAIFDKEHIKAYNNPITNKVLEIRKHEKYLGTYYSSFLHYADANDIIHAAANQGGTTTGRMSYSNPNLQNIPKEDEDFEELEYLVRGAFIPRDGFVFCMMDYDQQEYRMMLDYAAELSIIKKINEGMDVHEATAELMRVTRKQAKTLNFGLLYGMGADKLAVALGVSIDEAKSLRSTYFDALPGVKLFINTVCDTGKSRKHVRSWFSRRCYMRDSNFAYILPNHIIQGGCADVIKIAMNKIADYLEDKRSRMLVQVHDELLFEIHEDELEIQYIIKDMMENIYPASNGVKLTVGIDHSYTSWGYKDRISGAAE